jgi:septum formation protein
VYWQVAALRSADLVLASGSPRRKEILNDILGLRVRVVASKFEEDLDKSKYTPQEYGELLSNIQNLPVRA